MPRTSGRAWAGLAALVAGLSFVTPAAASGEEEGPAPTGVRLGIRSGFAIPAGAAFNGSGALADTITGYVPVRFDLGMRVARYFYAGWAVQHGVVLPAACPGDMQCSGTNTRFGVMLGAHLRPSAPVDPWLGVGFGYEVLSVTRSTGWSRQTLTATGLELLDAEIGVDVRTAGGLRFGPVLSASLGRYTSISLNGTPTSDFDRELHGWGLLGLRGAFEL